MTYIDTYDLKLLNKQHGFFFFEPGTMRFFASRVSQEAYLTEDKALAYFVSSEQFKSSANWDYDTRKKRLYTVRVCNLSTGDVDTVGEFQAYSTSASAHRAAKKLASGN